MKKLICYFSVTLVAVAASGCGRGNANTAPLPADKLAQTDPDAKARVLLDQMAAVPAEDRGSWVRERSIELSVFQAVTDPTLRARYETEIAPHLGTR